MAEGGTYSRAADMWGLFIGSNQVKRYHSVVLPMQNRMKQMTCAGIFGTTNEIRGRKCACHAIPQNIAK